MPSSSSATSNTSNDSKIRILVVDDEPDILLTLDAVLSGRGYYVKTFDNPVEALSHLTNSSSNSNADEANTSLPNYYDLVITDHRMPGSGITGVDLAKRVKEHNIRTRQRKTKVFLMSATLNLLSLPEEFVEALKPEIVDEFIQKPISNDKLIAIVEKSFLT